VITIDSPIHSAARLYVPQVRCSGPVGARSLFDRCDSAMVLMRSSSALSLRSCRPEPILYKSLIACKRGTPRVTPRFSRDGTPLEVAGLMRGLTIRLMDSNGR